MDTVRFNAPEYRADGSFREADYLFEGSPNSGWTVLRNGAPHLELGLGYRLLRTIGCGVCSTDLDRHFLPVPLPQVTRHESVATDDEGKRYVVEINASHSARGVASDCSLYAKNLAEGELPRADVAVVQHTSQVDEVLRPVDGSETSLVRPRGAIAICDSNNLGDSGIAAVVRRRLKLSSSRCGDFRRAMTLIADDPELCGLGSKLVTHRFRASEIVEAFRAARSPECTKAVIAHD